ncbi:cell division protein FtsQ/DivIB [Yaniella halotolerans]|uniref:cell division protein FtsQ/DivIB n=1 Tax=Yaniella halotolerans TaxID=225453 RepID=UPI0003B4A44E|nr:cell division protein FtsQ/DivIB [Yaniella halotolerans]
MSKNPPNDPQNSSQDADKVAQKFPGLAAKKPAKSISVERPVHVDEKTVTETGIPQTEDKAAMPKSVLEESPQADTGKQDETVLELPPSPEQRKAKRRRTIGISVLATLALLGGGWAVLFFSPILAIEDIEHEGLDLVTESQATERTTQLEGKPLPQVGERGVNELFEDIPAVKDVALRAEPPHGLVVNIHEHRPIAMGPRGKEYVVFSKDGTELAEITSKKAQEFDLPVVASAADVADEDVFNTITEVLGSLPDDLREQVRAASGSSIDSIELELTSGKMVMWGNNEEAEKKAQVLEALLGLEDDEAAEISEYDVSAPDFPVTR